jgi:hypothetical protein
VNICARRASEQEREKERRRKADRGYYAHGVDLVWFEPGVHPEEKHSEQRRVSDANEEKEVVVGLMR